MNDFENYIAARKAADVAAGADNERARQEAEKAHEEARELSQARVNEFIKFMRRNGLDGQPAFFQEVVSQNVFVQTGSLFRGKYKQPVEVPEHQATDRRGYPKHDYAKGRRVRYTPTGRKGWLISAAWRPTFVHPHDVDPGVTPGLVVLDDGTSKWTGMSEGYFTGPNKYDLSNLVPPEGSLVIDHINEREAARDIKFSSEETYQRLMEYAVIMMGDREPVPPPPEPKGSPYVDPKAIPITAQYFDDRGKFTGSSRRIQ